MKHVVSFSGGAASWAAAKRVAERHGTQDMVLLFADTKGDSDNPHDGEDEDLYRFLVEASENIGVPVTRISEGRTVWKVFHDERFIGNHLADPCSKILKRQMLDRWMRENCDATEVASYFGYTWEEIGRAETSIAFSPWPAFAPLCEPPEVGKADCYAMLAREGIELPRLYRMGFQHNNCGGFCIKAGLAQFAHLHRVMPERYRYHEEREQELRDYLGKDVSILRDRSGGESTPLTLRAFRQRLERQPSFFDADDWAGCGCMTPPEGQAA